MSLVHRRRARAPHVAQEPSDHTTARRPTARRPAARQGLGERLLRRVVEGAHAWGELEIWPSRYGYTSSCLVVYPPGATRTERIRYRLLRSWPPMGMLLGLIAVLAAAQTVPPLAAGLIGGAVYCSGAAGLALLAGPGRHRIRVLRACRGDDEGIGVLDAGHQSALDELSAVLLEAERELLAGRITAVAFELVQGEVWQRLGAARLRRA